MSIGLYAIGTTHQSLIYLRKLSPLPFISFLIGASAAILQLVVSYTQLIQSSHYNFNLFNTASLISGVIALGIATLSIRKNLHAITLLFYPIAIVTITTSALWGDQKATITPDDSGIIVHITLSIIAYSVLSIAAIQAILIYIQNNNLKKRNTTVLMRNLPPLLSMEGLLFEMLWSGTALLATAIFAGFLFVDDLFAQHLAHKTFFSLLSLAVFSTLLIGRAKYGWRGLTASKLTLWGASLLMLGFFGSKLALEWLLEK